MTLIVNDTQNSHLPLFSFFSFFADNPSIYIQEGVDYR